MVLLVTCGPQPFWRSCPALRVPFRVGTEQGAPSLILGLGGNMAQDGAPVWTRSVWGFIQDSPHMGCVAPASVSPSVKWVNNRTCHPPPRVAVQVKGFKVPGPPKPPGTCVLREGLQSCRRQEGQVPREGLTHSLAHAGPWGGRPGPQEPVSPAWAHLASLGITGLTLTPCWWAKDGTSPLCVYPDCLDRYPRDRRADGHRAALGRWRPEL